jgi:hypothetical protein
MPKSSSLLSALHLALEHANWQCDKDRADGRVLDAVPPGRGKELTIKFAIEDREAGFDDNIVQVVDDTRPYTAGLFVGLEDLISGKARSGRQRIWLGRSLLFPFLDSPGKCREQLNQYAASVQDAYLGSSEDRGNRQELPHERTRNQVELLEFIGDKIPPRKLVDVKDVALESQDGRSGLIAFDAVIDRNLFFYRNLFLEHVKKLAESDRDQGLARIPLFVSAAEVRALGLGRALWEAGYEATGLAVSNKFMTLLLELGFFHLYMPDIGSLRTDYDLDPNTQHIADIFAAAGQFGSFTLGCERELVFQWPLFGAKEDGTQLKTLGIRFYKAKNLTLWDTGPEPGPALFSQLEEYTRLAEDQAERIAKLSESCLSQCEAREALIRIAVIDSHVAGAGFPDTELERTLRSILTGDRLRPGNLRSTVAAMRNSDLLRPLAGGQLAIRSKVFAAWLIGDGIFNALKALCRQADMDPLDRLFQTANLPAYALQWAIAMGGDGFAKEIEKAIPAYLLRHRFREGGYPSQSALLENLWTLSLAIADTIQCGSTPLGEEPRSGTDIISDLCGQAVKMRSLALPQSCFSGLDLASWTFEDCNLRNSTFLECSLMGARMKDCLLSGASFERCDFGRKDKLTSFHSFQGSDVSGAEFLECKGLTALLQGDVRPELLERTNWTASGIIVNTTKGEIESAFDVVNQYAATAAGLLIGQIVGSSDRSEKKAPWPASAVRSFAHTQWNEHPILVKTPGALAGVLVKRSGFYEIIERSFQVTQQDALPPGIEWLEVSFVEEADGEQIFVAIDGEHSVWHLRVADGCGNWRRIPGIPDADRVAVTRPSSRQTDEERGDAVVVCVGTTGALWFGMLDHSGSVKRVWECDVKYPGGVSAMSWIMPQRATGNNAELLIGPLSGGAYVVRCTGRTWRATPFRDSPMYLTIDSFGYSPRENIAIACAHGGRVLGFHNIEPGWMEPLFRFHTAHEWFADVALLNHQGQMLVAGLAAGEGEGAENMRTVLWALVQPFGNVVTVVPLFPQAGEYQPPIKLDMDSDSGGEALRKTQAARIEQVRQSLSLLRPEKEYIEISPVLSTSVDLQLNVPPASQGSLDLPDSIDDPFGVRFRSIELHIQGESSHYDEGSQSLVTQSFERHYIESELDAVLFTGSQVRIRCSPRIHRGVQSAVARLSISYPSADRSRQIEGEWLFTLRFEWEDNPYVSDGAPVVGEQFFGLDEEIEKVVTAIQLGNHVIVRSCRRAGKSSFVLRVAQQLRERSRIAVVVTGNVIESKGIIPAIQEMLDAIGGQESRRDYRELGAIDLTGLAIATAFKQLSEAAIRKGYQPPFTVIIDEWGYLSAKPGKSEEHTKGAGAGIELTNRADELRSTAGIVLCLTSTPLDFPTADTASQSNDYRFFSTKIDIGRLRDDALRRLIVAPLEKRGIKIDEDVVRTVMRLSSGSPHDANILMHHALIAAKREGIRPSDKEVLTIHTHHLLPAEGGPNTEALNNLEQKYTELQRFLIEKLDPEERQEVFSRAGIDCLPTVEDPDRSQDARWDMEYLGVPQIREKKEDWRQLFSDAGYRVALHESEITDNGIKPGPSAYRLWIPWGMALHFRRLRDNRRG